MSKTSKPAVSPASRETLAEAMLTSSGVKAGVENRLQVDRQAMEFAARREIASLHESLEDPSFAGASSRYLQAVGQLQTKLDWSLVRAPIVDHYAKLYTDDQLKGIVAFFETEPGKAFRARQDAALRDTDTIVTGREAEMLPEFQSLTKAFRGSFEVAGKSDGTPQEPQPK